MVIFMCLPRLNCGKGNRGFVKRGLVLLRSLLVVTLDMGPSSLSLACAGFGFLIGLWFAFWLFFLLRGSLS